MYFSESHISKLSNYDAAITFNDDNAGKLEDSQKRLEWNMTVIAEDVKQVDKAKLHAWKMSKKVWFWICLHSMEEDKYYSSQGF